jgi:hypothetical protein
MTESAACSSYRGGEPRMSSLRRPTDGDRKRGRGVSNKDAKM